MSDGHTPLTAAPEQRRKVVGRPFAKGQSGNPGGRAPSLTARIRKATKDGAELVAFFVEAMRNTDLHWRDRIACAHELADRGFGKAPQPITNDETGGGFRVVVTYENRPVPS